MEIASENTTCHGKNVRGKQPNFGGLKNTHFPDIRTDGHSTQPPPPPLLLGIPQLLHLERTKKISHFFTLAKMPAGGGNCAVGGNYAESMRKFYENEELCENCEENMQSF